MWKSIPIRGYPEKRTSEHSFFKFCLVLELRIMFLYEIGWMYCWVHASAERRLIKQKKWKAWSARTDGRRLSPNRRRPWIGSERCCATSRDSTRLEICVGGRVVCICPVRGRDFLAFVRLKVLVKAGVSSCYYGNPRCSDVRKEHFDRRTCRLSPPLSCHY